MIEPEMMGHVLIPQLETVSEESRRVMATLSFYKLGETSRKIQCPSCWTYSKEGSVYSPCGICLMPSPEQPEKIKNRIDII